MLKMDYNYILDIQKIKDVYHTIRVNSKHKEKIVSFELFLSSNLIQVYTVLKNRTYIHQRYNIFLIREPKIRVIMSECMQDKIINHLVSKYILFPLIEPKLIEANVATREGKGSKKASLYMKRYINHLKENYEKIYVLKCDIHKYFYSIDHEILLTKLKKIIFDPELYQLVKTIVESTDYEYVEELLSDKIKNERERIQSLKISNQEKQMKWNELNRIPKFQKGKGLPIGNMSSQIMAIFYLNDLDHFIKEKLRIHHYIRYMDDLILIHPDKEYLKYCLCQIEEKVKNLKLKLNHKTQITELSTTGVIFLGYRFRLRDKRLYILMQNQTKKRIRRRMKKKNTKNDREELLMRYNGYLSHCHSNGFRYQTIYKK